MPPAPQLPKTTQGPANAVPCPYCGKPNNFAGHAEMLETGNVFRCDMCGNMIQIAGVKMVKMIYLRAPRGRVQSVKPRG